jgi:DNA helicase II / ATP-dependent DNA helicase PcrA
VEPVAPPPSGRGDRFDRALADLTPAQRRAVDAPARALCIVAGAGSGKTRVLTLRVARRIRDGSADADHTVVCTFTRKAAFELRDRLGHFGVPVSTPPGPGGVPSPGVRAGTLHQLALTLLRREAADTGRPPPGLVEHRWRTLVELTGDRGAASAADTEIGWAKARCLAPDAYADAALAGDRSVALPLDRVASVYADYQERLARRSLLDLDDVLLRAADLLLDDPVFAEQAHWRYRHLAVDEFQDVNPAQFRLVLALMGARADLCTVGDPNQAIYGWNGADPGLLASLSTVVAGLEVVHLESNHRCSPQVVAVATAALGPVDVAPPRSAVPDGPVPTVTAFVDERAEADAVAGAILRRAEAGTPLSDQAVLARTHDQLAVVRRALDRVGVPCRFAPAPDAEAGPATSPGRTGPGRTAPTTVSTAVRGEPAGGVELATFHRAKGLEWEAVHVIGLEDGFVPIVHAATPQALAEERRLLYVALTRAGRVLDCSWARSRTMGGRQPMERRPSPWLEELAGSCGPGEARAGPRDSAQRFADLRANLKG